MRRQIKGVSREDKELFIDDQLGDHCRWYEKERSGGTRWKRWDFKNLEDPHKHPVCKHCMRPIPRDKRNGTLRGTEETLSCDEMWDTLFRYNRRGSVLAASGAQRIYVCSFFQWSVLIIYFSSRTRTKYWFHSSSLKF